MNRAIVCEVELPGGLTSVVKLEIWYVDIGKKLNNDLLGLFRFSCNE